MSFDPITNAARLSYQENVQLALQQKRSRLAMCGTIDPQLKGKAAQIVQLMGAREGQYDLPRNASVQIGEGAIEQVWCKPRRLNTVPVLLEKEDFIKNGTDYSSSYVQSDAATLNRMTDKIMSDALWAARIIGEDATGTQAYSNPNGSVAVNYVPSGAPANSGLTIPKLVKGLELLELAEVDLDEEEIFLQVTSQQVTNLYNELGFTSGDYTDRQKLQQVRSKVHELIGVKIIRMPNAWVKKTSTTRNCMLFAKSGLVYGDFAPAETMMEKSPTHFNRILLGAEKWMGATRTEDQKFVQVDCIEA